MASLDYGAPDDGDDFANTAPGPGGHGDSALDADADVYADADADDAMAGIVNNPEVSIDELYEAQAQSKANAVPTRFYEYPAQDAIGAAARRAVEPLGLNPAALDAVFPHEFTRAADSDDQDGGGSSGRRHLEMPAVSYASSTGAPNLRLTALHIAGQPITQLSTSRLFAYLTYFGAQPLGLEWIDDERAVIVFAEPEAARIAFEYLCPAGAGRFRRRKKRTSHPSASGENADPADVKPVKREKADDDGTTNAAEDMAEDDIEELEDIPQETSLGPVISAAELADLLEYIGASSTAGKDGQDAMDDDGGDEDASDVEPRTIDDALLARLLTPRQAHRVPLSLYTVAEREALHQAEEHLAQAGLAGGAQDEEPLTMLDADGNRIPIPADAPAIYRELAEEERRSAAGAAHTPETRKLLALRGVLRVRFALQGRPDIKERGARSKSKWFSDHGLDAGREVVPRLLTIAPLGVKPDQDDDRYAGGVKVKEELFPDRAPPPSLARPEAWDDDRTRARGRGRGQTRAAMDDLDDELERYNAQRDAEAADGDRDDRYVRKEDDEERWPNDRVDELDRPHSRPEHASGGRSDIFDRFESSGGAGRRRREAYRDRERSPARRDDRDDWDDSYGRDGDGIDEFGRERRRKRDYAQVKGRGSVRGALAWDDTDTGAAPRRLHSRLATLGERMSGTGEEGRALLARFGEVDSSKTSH